VTDKELKVLRARKRKITPGKTNAAGLRQAIIRVWQIGSLIEKPKSKKSGSVQGQEYLWMITAPKALNQSSADMLNITTAFLRKSLSVETLHSTSRQNGVSPRRI